MYGRLPQKVSALNNTILVYDLKKLGLPDIQELFAITADGREWFVGRAEINRILNNDEFKAARRPIPTAKSS